MDHPEKFVASLVRFQRRITIDVPVGGVCIGSSSPVVIQSMATEDTNQTLSCVVQAVRIADAGGRMVRFTAQGQKEAANLEHIKNALRQQGYSVPLVADIHFNPSAALVAARHVEKVRINPGNFVDKRAVFSGKVYSEESYRVELQKLEEKFGELLEACETHGTALRIGVNHGSLSDRIMSRYGDTPAGMVESAMEFLRVCRKRGFERVVLSMKSSNTRTMVHACRLLVAAMNREGMVFPLHLGVTEAGEGEDGRIKSAAGIGALLADGIGDTIRVSLTEAPEKEIPVAEALAGYFRGRENHPVIPGVCEELYQPFVSERRGSVPNGTIGGENPVAVVLDLSHHRITSQMLNHLAEIPSPPDFVYVGDDDTVSGKIELIRRKDISTFGSNESGRFAECSLNDLTGVGIEWLRRHEDTVLILNTGHINGIAEQRAFFLRMKEYGLRHPVIIKRSYDEKNLQSLQIKAAADTGMLFIDGFGDGLWIENRNAGIRYEDLLSINFGILQATGARISRTEWISCPGCGRTLFDLEETVRRVREKTGGLKGLKIAVMGCIVNGPGEMADADYGYVGSGKGKVTLYKKKEVVKRAVPQENAVDELVELIKKCGDWK